MTNLAIAANGLRKSYRDKVVLDGVDLAVAEGTIFALLGPNGAGKTTTVQILSTLTPADGGTVQVAGHDLARQPDDVRGAIGVTGQYSAVDKLLTGEENLLLMADLKHLSRREGKRKAAELLDRFDLVDAARKPAGTYSGGVTIFLTTQYLEEADELADHIALLDHGRLIAEGTAEELKRRIPGGHIELTFADPHLLDAARQLVGAGIADPEPLTLQVPSDGSVRAIRELLALMDEHSIDIEDLSVHTPDLDDVFLTLTSRQKETTR